VAGWLGGRRPGMPCPARYYQRVRLALAEPRLREALGASIRSLARSQSLPTPTGSPAESAPQQPIHARGCKTLLQEQAHQHMRLLPTTGRITRKTTQGMHTGEGMHTGAVAALHIGCGRVCTTKTTSPTRQPSTSCGPSNALSKKAATPPRRFPSWLRASPLRDSAC
jgi:hypothetical protein